MGTKIGRIAMIHRIYWIGKIIKTAFTEHPAYRREIAVLLLLHAIQSVLLVLFPFYLASTIEMLTRPHRQLRDIFILAVIGACNVSVRITINVLHSLWTSHWEMIMRQRVIHHAVFGKIPPQYRSPGELLTRVQQDIPGFIHNGFSTIVMWVTSVMSLMTLFILGLSLNYTLTVLIGSAIPLYLILPLLLKRPIVTIQNRTREASAVAINWSLELVKGAAVARLMQMERQEWLSGQTTILWSRERMLSLRHRLFQASSHWSNEIIRFGVTLGILGVAFIPHSSLGVGTVLAFVMFNERLAQPIISLSQTPLNWASTMLNAKRLEPYLMPDAPAPMVWASGELALNNVTIRAGDGILFDRYTLAIPTSGVAVISGKNGSGKSTLLSAILQIIPLEAGTLHMPVRWDERGALGFIPQEVAVFPGSLRDNLLLGLKHPDSLLLFTLERLGWRDAPLDASYTGASPSKGQRQRIGVARILLGGPYRAVLVDEVESGLDDPVPLIAALREVAPFILVVSHHPELWAPYDTAIDLGAASTSGNVSTPVPSWLQA